MKPWGYLLLTVPVGIAVLYGCAEAPEDDLLTGNLPTEPADAGKDKGTSIKLPETEDEDDDLPPPSSSSSSSSGAVSPPKDAGPPPPPPGPDPCAKTTCNTAKNLGSIGGDNGAESKTETGGDSKWFTVHVEEKVTGLAGLIGQGMRVKATLTSPPGKNFDLFVYRKEDADAKECHAVAKSSESPTDPDVVSLSWGEPTGGDPNGFRDDSTVTFEVREVGGTTCDPTATWKLKIEGNK